MHFVRHNIIVAKQSAQRLHSCLLVHKPNNYILVLSMLLKIHNYYDESTDKQYKLTEKVISFCKVYVYVAYTILSLR